MKNIHVLQTEKPSRLVKFFTNKFHLCKEILPIQDEEQYQNIYITNSEKIKEGDYVLYEGEVFKVLQTGIMYNDDFTIRVNDEYTFINDKYSLKIILTTDRKLIKDGVQAIEDGFLEWFVKNPSCESVEVKSLKTIPALQLTGNNHCMYQLIVPKEELKQETLEEVAERYANMHQDVSEGLGTYLVKAVFQDGAKWQQEQDNKLYSEEELLQILESHKDNLEFDKDRFEHDRWFEQFKKK